MKVALVLFGYAALLAAVGPMVLRRAGWVDRAPRLGVLMWLVLVASIVASVVLAGFSLAVPIGTVSGDLAALLRACVMALRAQYATSGGAAVGVVGAVLSLLVIARLVYCAAAAAAESAALRRDQLRVMAIVGHRDPRWDAVIVDHDVAAAYCLPGRRQRVVVSSEALRTLADDEIDAVLAHERAHLRGRHHLLVGAVTAVARAFWFVPVFGVARHEVSRLVELLADDAATRTCSRLAMADALLGVAAVPAPTGALGAGGTSTALRVRRLIEPHVPLSRGRRLVGTLAVGVLLAVPVLVATGPAIVATQLNYCPVPL
ncbi:MAG: M48 family metalloprotease [Streptosporangiales bacterium]|nr:M48 family metalloprotease [Streptosporangiales bacterium]